MTAAATPAGQRRRPGRGARRFGYAVAILVNAALLVAVNVWPGWWALPFLTADTTRVLGWVNASIAVGVVLNVVYLVADPRPLRALGDIVTAAVGLVPLILLWRVFPFDFPAGFDWALLARTVLGLGIFGSVVGVIAGIVALLRA